LQPTNSAILEVEESEETLQKLDDRVKPYVYNLELLETMLEHKAKSAMSQRRKAPKDLDRLYMTSAAYKQQQTNRSSLQDTKLAFEDPSQAGLNTEMRKSMPDKNSVRKSFEQKLRRRHEIYTDAKEL